MSSSQLTFTPWFFGGVSSNHQPDFTWPALFWFPCRKCRFATPRFRPTEAVCHHHWGIRRAWVFVNGDGWFSQPIGSMYDIYANIWGILMVNVTRYSIQYMDPMGNGKSNTQGNLLVGGSVLQQIQVFVGPKSLGQHQFQAMKHGRVFRRASKSSHSRSSGWYEQENWWRSHSLIMWSCVKNMVSHHVSSIVSTFPIIFPTCSHHFPNMLPTCSHHFPNIFPTFATWFSEIYQHLAIWVPPNPSKSHARWVHRTLELTVWKRRVVTLLGETHSTYIASIFIYKYVYIYSLHILLYIYMWKVHTIYRRCFLGFCHGFCTSMLWISGQKEGIMN